MVVSAVRTHGKRPFSTKKMVKFDSRRLGQQMEPSMVSFVPTTTQRAIDQLVSTPKHPFFILIPAFLPSKRQHFLLIIIKW